MTKFSTMKRRAALIATLWVVLAASATLCVSAFAQTQGAIPPPTASQSAQLQVGR